MRSEWNLFFSQKCQSWLKYILNSWIGARNPIELLNPGVKVLVRRGQKLVYVTKHKIK